MHPKSSVNAHCILLLAAIITTLSPAFLLAQNNKKKDPPPAKVAPVQQHQQKTRQQTQSTTQVKHPGPVITERLPVKPTVVGHQVPPGGTSASTKSGGAVVKRSTGKVSDIHDAQRNMDIHHNLNGTTRVSKTLPNKSQVVAVKGGPSYVQSTYTHNGHTYAARTYVYNGRTYNRYYNVYPYRNGYLNVYSPGFYYAPGFYAWVYAPWGAPANFSWGWAGVPWYGFYGGYFAASPFYPSASLWLTDYMVSSDLSASYQEQQAAAQDAPADQSDNGATNASASQPVSAGTPALTPAIKGMIATEVESQIDLEKREAAQNAEKQDPDPGNSNIAKLLSEPRSHVFVVGAPLDVLDTSSAECSLSEGDVLNMVARFEPGAAEEKLVVLSSKGARECAKNATVTIAIADLQDMQNHMRESIDQGLQELQAKQGQAGLPATPADAKVPPVAASVTTDAPAADANVAIEVKQELAEAGPAEKEVVAQAQQEATPASTGTARSEDPVRIALGQTIDEVTASLGSPITIIDLGPKKIYKYQDMKVTFTEGKVSDVE